MKKRKLLSLKRLFMLAIGYCKSKEDANKEDMEKVADYLKYVSIHKDDDL